MRRLPRKKDRVSILIVLSIVLTFLASLSQGHDTLAQRGAGGILRIYLWQATTTLNPHLSTGTKDLSPARLTYEPLATVDAEGNMIPILASEIPSAENGGVAADGKSVTWKLREGVLWSDGEPFTADDVLFTYEYITNPDVASTSLSSYTGIERVEAVDDLTVTIHFTEVNPAWAIPFVGVLGQIIPRHVFADFMGSNAADAPANRAPVGTGPFRVTEYKTEGMLLIGEDAVSTVRIIFEANPNYREPDKPFFSGVEVQGGGGDALVAAQLVIDDQIDYAWNVQVDDAMLASIEQGGEAELHANFDAFTERIMINFTDPNREGSTGERSSIDNPHPFFSDKLVRQAFAHAVDRDAIAALFGISGKPTTNLIVVPPELHSENTQAMYPFDLERAATLLDEAGWTDSDGNGIRDKDGVEMRVVFLTSINPVRQATQEIVRNALESIGVAVENKSVDSSVLMGAPVETTNTRRQFFADLAQYALSNKSPDPTSYLAGWTCEQIAQQENNWSKANWSRYCNPEFDALYEQVLGETDPAVRAELFVAMNDFLIEDVALIPMVHTAQVAAIRTNITGISITPWEPDVWNIADWRAR